MNSSNIIVKVSENIKKNINSGQLFIISAPSGAGKTTLCKIILDRFPDLLYSVSFTTRQPRQGEKDGKDYHFITKEEFLSGIKKEMWAEWAEVYGNYYGTSAYFLNNAIAKGENVLIDIDVQGASIMLQLYPDSVTIFIQPPSIDVLKSRLKKRGTDSEETIKKRMAAVEQEIAQQHLYTYTVINDDLSKAAEELTSIVSGAMGCDEKYQN
ncbi:MAG: guanylate kinase [Deltaproteobacteria bacterium]|nr:guanylate kinase [Deltaproteobacteria bacterium]